MFLKEKGKCCRKRKNSGRKNVREREGEKSEKKIREKIREEIREKWKMH